MTGALRRTRTHRANQTTVPPLLIEPEDPATSRKAPRRLPGWFIAVADQGVIAVTNLGLSICFARLGGLAALGIFALISVTLLSSLGIVRTLLGDPWLARPSSEGEALPSRLRGWYVVSALLSCLPVAVVAVVARGGDTAWLLTILVAPLMILQDGGRYAAYKRLETQKSLTSDVFLLLGVALGSAVAFAADSQGVFFVIVSWILGYLFSFLPLWRLLRGRVSLKGAPRWWSVVCKPLGMPLLLDSVAFFVSTNVTMYLLAVLASSSVVGHVRVINSVYSPVAMVFTGITLWMIPWLSRRDHADTRRVQQLVTQALAAVAVVLVAAMVAVGPWLAPLLFGRDAVPTRSALLIGGGATFFNALSSTWLAAVRVFGRYRPVSWGRAVTGGGMVSLVLVVPLFRTVDGYWALVAAQNLAIAILAWLARWRALRRIPDVGGGR